MLKLVIEDGDGTTHVVPIIRDQITIGREEGNTIRLTERNVSRHHARLTRSAGETGTTVILEDLASYNGIRVNGLLVTGKQTLVPDDTMQIGDYFIAIESDVKSTVVTSAIDATVTEMENTEELNPAIDEPKQGRLVVVSSNLAGTCYWMNRREMLIGRSDAEGNDIVVKHRSISRHHAKIIYRDGGYILVDLASSNGVLVNGVPSGTTSLINGDIIEMGHVKLRFCSPGDSYVFQVADIDDVVIASQGSPWRFATSFAAFILIVTTAYMIKSYDSDTKKGTAPRANPSQESTATSDQTVDGQSSQLAAPRSTNEALLAEAQKWADSREWKTAAAVCVRLTEDGTVSPEIKLAAEKLQRRVNQETINLERLDRLKALDSTLDDEAALAAELPTEDSVYIQAAEMIKDRVVQRSIATATSQFELNLDDGDLSAAQKDLEQLSTLGVDAARLESLNKALEERKAKPKQTQSTTSKVDEAGIKEKKVNRGEKTAPPAEKSAKPQRPAPEQESTNTVVEPNVEKPSRQQESKLKFFEAAWRIAQKDKNSPSELLHQKSKALCNLTDEMNLTEKAIVYCSEQAKYEKNIHVKRALERKIQRWKQ